VSIALTANRCY